ncbi:MAG TPA: fumarylacetoacetate hydrolase family protein [Chloroflexia bacterium]|nr:fumarylacetoacetate hydrolase family protein [Chloroflexia bacterium]
MAGLDTRALAAEIYQAHNEGSPVTSRPSSRDESFDLSAAYAVENELARLRRSEGHATNGRKIGFTNKTLWPRLEIDNIVWGYTFDDTVFNFPGNQAKISLAKMVAPKLEPEIVFKMRQPLSEGVAPVDALSAVEWIALGFEIVDCPYPNWRFRPADMVAAFGFHAALLIGEPRPLEDLPKLAEQLANFKLKLYKNGELAAEGAGSNVYDSPALCLGRLAQTLSEQAEAEPLAAGEVVTSGTLTDATPVAAGQEWRAEVEGLDLPGFSVRFES